MRVEHCLSRWLYLGPKHYLLTINTQAIGTIVIE